jgi:hypothetical protein
MNYFENLPIVNINDEEFRNLFHRVLITYVKDEQISTYQWKDGDTLPLIAYRLYGSAQLWWVLALLNDIRDINYDMPLTTQQIEDIASETATYYQFSDSVLASGNQQIDTGYSEITVEFPNDDSADYTVILTPLTDDISLFESKGYGYQKIDDTSFKIVLDGNLSDDMIFSYVVFRTPSIVAQINTANYSDYYTNMLSEADDKRDIKILKSPYLSDFITYFLLILQNGPDAADLLMEGEEIDYGKEPIQEINSLKEFSKDDVAEHGSFVVMDVGNLSGNSGSYSELEIENYDFNQQIYITPNPVTKGNLSDVGNFGVRPYYLKPRVYNTGTSTEKFSYVVLSPDDSSFDVNTSILESGIATFAGKDSSTIITIGNHDEIEDEDDICLLITPIVDVVHEFEDVGNFSFIPLDLNHVAVLNSGEETCRFYWSLWKGNPPEESLPNFIIGGGQPPSSPYLEYPEAGLNMIIPFCDSDGKNIIFGEEEEEFPILLSLSFTKFDTDGSITGTINKKYQYQVPEEELSNYTSLFSGAIFIPSVFPCYPSTVFFSYEYEGNTYFSHTIRADMNINVPSGKAAFMYVENQKTICGMNTYDDYSEELYIILHPESTQEELNGIASMGDFFLLSSLFCVIPSSIVPFPIEGLDGLIFRGETQTPFVLSSNGMYNVSGIVTDMGERVDGASIEYGVSGTFSVQGLVTENVWPQFIPSDYSDIPDYRDMTYIPNSSFIGNITIVEEEIPYSSGISGNVTGLLNEIPFLSVGPESSVPFDISSSAIGLLIAKPYTPTVVSENNEIL